MRQICINIIDIFQFDVGQKPFIDFQTPNLWWKLKNVA